MKTFIYACLFGALALTSWSCKDNSTSPEPEIEEASAEKQFVWNAMNYWYFWQTDVPDLADDRFSDDQAFQNYLMDFTDEEALFNELVYEQVDDFSFFIEDYVEFQQSQQGISESFGYEFGLVCIEDPCSDILGYVQYVLPNSPAKGAGLQRGDLFTRVDGTQLTNTNFQDLLFGTTSYVLGLAKIENNTISNTGETVSLQAVTLQENPVFLSRIIEKNGAKIGYLVYNAFRSNFHRELNEVFGTFAAAGIDELVVDLRYNGGGAVVSSAVLAGMISGLDDTNEFARFTFNNKRSDNNQSFPIFNMVPLEDDTEIAMNQLSLNQVYFLTGRGTASASEALINGLEPYMNVFLVGRQTVGKDEGSLTLYDAPVPYTNQENANPSHKRAIQPIILKIVNTEGRDYPQGFLPDEEVNEINFLENLPPLGNEMEPLLAKALERITGAPMAKAKPSEAIQGYLLMDSRDLRTHGKEMYLLPETVKEITQ